MDVSRLESLIDLHGTALYRFCCRMTGSRTDADDLYQDIFLRAIEKCGAIDEARNAKSFLFSMAVFTYRSHRRKLSRRERIAPRAGEIEEAFASDGLCLEDAYVSREQQAAVRRFVAEMGDAHRVPLVLHYAAGLSVEEIARTLRLPVGTVKSRMHKARTTLRKKMEEDRYAAEG